MDENQMKEIHRRRKWLQRENPKWPEHPMQVPVDQWPDSCERNRIAIWRSRDFLVQVFLVATGLVRMTICRSEIDDAGRWRDNISWDDLQRLKNQCGFAGKDALEVYPAMGDEVNVANMRHLWVVDERVSFAWRGKNNDGSETQNENQQRRF